MPSPNLPRINRMQFGVIDQNYMNNLADGVQEFSDMRGAIDDVLSHRATITNPPFLAIITDAIPFVKKEVERADGRKEEDVTIIWSYKWKKVQVESLLPLEPAPSSDEPDLRLQFTNEEDAITDEDASEVAGDANSGFAFNVAELSNQLTFPIVNNMDIESQDYPATHYPQPLATNSTIMLTSRKSNDPTLFYTFERSGSHGGEKDWFYAKLLRAHVLDEQLFNQNVFEYAFCKVTPKSCTPFETCGVDQAAEFCAECLQTRGKRNSACSENYCSSTTAIQGFWRWEEDLSVTSWGDNLDPEIGWSDAGGYDPNDPVAEPCVPLSINSPCNQEPYTFPAMNLMELFNTGIETAPATDETKGIGNFLLNAIGGGSTVLDYPIAHDNICPDDPFVECTQYEFPLAVTPIVRMRRIYEPNGAIRFVFQASNAYDGTCVTCT